MARQIIRFDNSILGGEEAVFTRGVATKDDRGLLLGVNDPRWADEAVIAGGIDASGVVELMPSSTYFVKVLRTGIDADGTTPITVTTERTSNGAGLSINIYYGPVRALKAAGTPTLAGNGYGKLVVTGVGEWHQWLGSKRGLGQGDISALGLTALGGVTSGASGLGLPHNVADDFGASIGNMRVDGDGVSGGNTAYDSDGAVIFIPRSAMVMWGCVMLQCTALRYASGTVAGGTAQYVPLGTGFFYWQRGRDAGEDGGGWVTLRGEDDFTLDTGGVKHDPQPGRFRGEAWNLQAYTTWRRSNDRPDRFEYSSSDYMAAGPAPGVGPDAAAQIAQTFWGRFRRDPGTGLWSHVAALERTHDQSGHATLGSGTAHIHGSAVIECVEAANGRNSEQRIALCGDPGDVNGLCRSVYAAGAGYDPDDASFDAHFGDIDNWSADDYILGDGAQGPGSRQMSAQQGPEFGDLILFSDDTNEDVLLLGALTEGDPITTRAIYGQSQDAYAYTFRVNADKPATPGCRMVCDPHNNGLDADKTKAVMYSPDGGGTWVPVWRSDISNLTVGISGDDLILGSLNGGMYAVPIPRVVRATPICLAPGGKNCAVDNYFTTKFGAAAPTNLSRTGGVFMDGATALPPDPSLMSRAVKYAKAAAADNLVIHPGDTTSVGSTGGGFTDADAMRTFVVNILANPDESPGSSFLAADLRFRTFNNIGDTSQVYAQRCLGQAHAVVTDGSRWFRDGFAVAHAWGPDAGDDTSTVQMRLNVQDFGGVIQAQRYRLILEGVYEGDAHVPYPVAPDSDASASPESVAFGAPVDIGSTLFGAFTLGRTVSGSLAWYATTTLAAIRVPISFAEVGDTGGDNWFVAEFMLGVPSGGQPTTRTLRLRGKAGGVAFDEEVAIGSQSLAGAGEYLMFYPGCPVLFAFSITAGGIVPVVYVDGFKVTDDQPIANTDGFDAEMIWTQIGADFEEADARAAELLWFGASVDEDLTEVSEIETLLQTLGFLSSAASANTASSSGMLVGCNRPMILGVR